MHSIKWTSLAIVAFWGFTLTADGQDDAQTKEDLAAVRSYLNEKYPGKKWQRGPERLSSAELTRAYGKGRLYYIFSSPPLPPGAALPDLIEAFQKRLEEHKKTNLSLTIHIDDRGKLTPWTTVEEFGGNLMQVTSIDDAKIAAAAALSLYHSGNAGPGIVAADKVTVRETKQGLLCTAQPNRFISGTVLFDEKGKLTRISKVYIGPQPP